MIRIIIVVKMGGDEMIAKKDSSNKTRKLLMKTVRVGIRTFLVTIVIFLAVFVGMSFISLGDSFYHSIKGDDKNPLFETYVIVTESMVPTIKVNDAVVVTRASDDNIDIGDIITFSSNHDYYTGLTVTHRVVGKQLTGNGKYVYRTKGDNNLLADTALVDLDSIYGKVILKIPKVGYIKKFVSSTSGFIISIVAPVFMVIVYEIYRVGKLIKKRKRELEVL